jgi:hypothetical protein
MRMATRPAPWALLPLWALCTLWALPASAQQPTTQLIEGRPWAQGISKEAYQAAIQSFETGNALLKDALFTDAAKQYSEALRRWNHPAIHYNLALALLNLDRPADVYEHMLASTRHGPGPLEETRYRHALRYTERMRKEYAWLTVITSPGASVALTSGEGLRAVEPGRFEGLLRPGAHTLIATKEGHLPTNIRRTFSAGERAELQINIYTEAERTRYVRRWSAWKPWAVVGAGAALAAGGGLLQFQSNKSYRNFDAGVEACAASVPTNGCKPEASLAALRTRGETQHTVAVGSWIAGGAVLVTGAVLVYANRPQNQIVDLDENGRLMAVAPLVSGDTRGVLAMFRF